MIDGQAGLRLTLDTQQNNNSKRAPDPNNGQPEFPGARCDTHESVVHGLNIWSVRCCRARPRPKICVIALPEDSNPLRHDYSAEASRDCFHSNSHV
jgi:hypothetical protein